MTNPPCQDGHIKAALKDDDLEGARRDMHRSLALAIALLAIAATTLWVLDHGDAPRGPTPPATATMHDSGVVLGNATPAWSTNVTVPQGASELYVTVDWYGPAPMRVKAIAPNGTVTFGTGPPNYPFATLHVDGPSPGVWILHVTGNAAQRFNVKTEVTK